MIGVIPKKHEKEIVEEFFQLFKTPWEFYDENHSYDVVIVTRGVVCKANARLLLIYGSERNQFDCNENIALSPISGKVFVQCGNVETPIYGNISALEGVGKPTIRVKGGFTTAGLEVERSRETIFRIGYDLFEEVRFLLSEGQPPENAHIPALEHHIAMLRGWIVNMRIPLIEIPPVPAGYNFIACLTHDVDFVRIRDHKFDHTMWGFVCRATIGSFLNVLKNRITWSRFFQNWKAALSLPLIYLGICRDIWLQFDKYLEIEKDACSTFFIIPFKKKAGNKLSGRIAKRRASKYDITSIQDIVKNLVKQGHEVGVHGIDAWHNIDLGRKELNRIYQVTGQSDIGIRIHWLYFNDQSHRILEKAGFKYDSTFGYNDTVGYRGGTAQAFRPLDVRHLLELPLHIQDTALFSSGYMNLTDIQAWSLCSKLIEKALMYGGVLTILWHQRSIAPERLYGDFYIDLLRYLKENNVWFATGGQAVQWFKKRRDFNFNAIQHVDDTVTIRYNDSGTDIIPPLMLRIHKRKPPNNDLSHASHSGTICIDIPLTGDIDEHFSFAMPGFEINASQENVSDNH